MTTETQLWAWFLFGSGLLPQRAKTLLAHWQERGLTLQAALNQLPAQAQSLGLQPGEANHLRPPDNLPAIAALRNDEPLYPIGLRHLPPKLRPALLFYTGAAWLLMRPIIYLAPDAIPPDVQEPMREAVSILLGEYLLPAAFRNSAQAALLLEEMIDSEGETLLFAREGVDRLVFSDQEQALLEAGRLLIVTPLPPDAAANPSWDSLLQQIATAAAARRIVVDPASLQATGSEISPPTLLLTSSSLSEPLPQATVASTNPADILAWIADVPEPALPTSTPGATTTEPAPEPPSSPEEVLRTLEVGGRVPEALRKKLLGQ